MILEWSLESGDRFCTIWVFEHKAVGNLSIYVCCTWFYQVVLCSKFSFGVRALIIFDGCHFIKFHLFWKLIVFKRNSETY